MSAPTVSQHDVLANVIAEYYFTAEQGAYQANKDEGIVLATHASLALLTFCVLVLKNGYTVTGESACVSPENFNAELGRRLARDKAVDKIWPLMGYALKERIANDQ